MQMLTYWTWISANADQSSFTSKCLWLMGTSNYFLESMYKLAKAKGLLYQRHHKWFFDGLCRHHKGQGSKTSTFLGHSLLVTMHTLCAQWNVSQIAPVQEALSVFDAVVTDRTQQEFLQLFWDKIKGAYFVQLRKTSGNSIQGHKLQKPCWSILAFLLRKPWLIAHSYEWCIHSGHDT